MSAAPADIEFVKRDNQVHVRGVSPAGQTWLDRNHIAEVMPLNAAGAVQMLAVTAGLVIEFDIGRKGIRVAKSVSDILAAHEAITKEEATSR